MEAERWRRLVLAGRGLWGRLSLCARLAQLGGLITRGRAPDGEGELLVALQEAGAKAEAHAGRLGRHGFGEEERAALRGVVEQLAMARPLAARPAKEEESGALQVLRGAILGDIALLCQAAKQVLPEPQLQALRLRRALLLRG